VNLLFVWGFAISVFIPVKYVYPSRTVKLRAATLALTIAWTTVLGIVIALYSEEPGAWAHRSPLRPSHHHHLGGHTRVG
jgi:VIT1/CCC1 family predicted Fe2+/Mn2+ transporter